jgi:hypothetical protein
MSNSISVFGPEQLLLQPDLQVSKPKPSLGLFWGPGYICRNPKKETSLQEILFLSPQFWDHAKRSYNFNPCFGQACCLEWSRPLQSTGDVLAVRPRSKTADRSVGMPDCDEDDTSPLRTISKNICVAWPSIELDLDAHEGVVVIPASRKCRAQGPISCS